MDEWLAREAMEGGVAVVRMSHGAENRVSGPFCDALRAMLGALAEDEAIRAVVVTGKGRFFCNGLDLDWVSGRAPEEAVAMLDGVSGLLRDTVLFPKPVVGAVNGHAFGFGAIWASGFDARIMRRDRGWVCYPMLAVGLPLTPGMLACCEHGLGRTVFREMAWLGRRYAGSEAVSLGWADAAVDEPELLEEAVARAHALGAKGTAFSLTKGSWARRVVEVIDTQDPAANRAFPFLSRG